MPATTATSSAIAPSGSTRIVKIPPDTTDPTIPKTSNRTAMMYSHIWPRYPRPGPTNCLRDVPRVGSSVASGGRPLTTEFGLGDALGGDWRVELATNANTSASSEVARLPSPVDSLASDPAAPSFGIRRACTTPARHPAAGATRDGLRPWPLRGYGVNNGCHTRVLANLVMSLLVAVQVAGAGMRERTFSQTGRATAPRGGPSTLVGRADQPRAVEQPADDKYPMVTSCAGG